MYQQITLVGNLGRDPEMRYTAEGRPVTNFSMAVNRKWRGADEEMHEQTTWFRITAWGRLAETCNEYLTKGRQVLVVGRLNTDSETGGPRVWTGSDGKPRASFEVTAGEVRFLHSGGESTPLPESTRIPDEGEEDLPF